MDFEEEDDFYHDNAVDWAKESAEGGINYSAASGRRSRRNHYKILQEEDIKQLQQNDISTVSGVLLVTGDVACTLLLQNNWSLNSLYDEWFLDDHGGRNPNSAAKPADPQSSCKHVCKICYEEIIPENTVSTTCGHPFCAECWKNYIATAINDGPGCLTLRCPEPGCNAAIGSYLVDGLASENEKDKFYTYLRRSYVERSHKRKWCPAPGCDRAIEFDAFMMSKSYDVVCDCSRSFCWRCAEESHRPVDCEVAAEWLGKYAPVAEEALSTKWVSSNTKRCPKCHRPIQKTRGCNHMTCSAPCRFEFCWRCLRPWKDHVRCRVEEEEEEEEEEEGEEEEEEEEEGEKLSETRHKYYYEGWNSNEECRWRAVVVLNEMRRKSGGGAKTEAEQQLVIMEALEKIVEFRRAMKWSYVHGFFSSENMEKMRLECTQKMVEAAVERLQNWVEKKKINCKDVKEFLMNLIDLTLLTGKCLDKFLVALENVGENDTVFSQV